MQRYIKAEKIIDYLKRKIKTSRSTIEINKLLPVIEENTVGERIAVKYPRWINVKDRLPDDGQYVLIRHTYHSGSCDRGHDEFESITAGYYFKHEINGSKFFYYAGISNYGDMVRANSMCPGNKYVTHWMPMPEPPREENENV